MNWHIIRGQVSSRDSFWREQRGERLAQIVELQLGQLQEIGSNLTLRDRRLNFEPRGAWQLLLEEGFAAEPLKEGQASERETLGPEPEERKKRSFLERGRMFFQEHPTWE